MGGGAYPDTRALLITADAGGSNGARVRLWKWALHQFATRTGLAIGECHFHPGQANGTRSSRLFSQIAMNRRGKPLTDLATIVSLIGATTWKAGLRIRSEIDPGRYLTLYNSRRPHSSLADQTPDQAYFFPCHCPWQPDPARRSS